MWLLHVYQGVVVHMLLNTRAFSCHFGLLSRAAHSGSEDVRTALQPPWDIDVMISTRASAGCTHIRDFPFPFPFPVSRHSPADGLRAAER